MAFYVIDSNVLIVASELSAHVSPRCVMACVDALERIRARGRLLIDTLGLVLSEYMDTLGYAGKPGVGRAFAKWAFDHQSNTAHVRQVPISVCSDVGWCQFNEFPADDELRDFHRDDQKFVAVALASEEEPPILNAVDSDWWEYGPSLARHGVVVNNLCPDQHAAAP